MSEKLRVLWTHNFNPEIKNKGNFIYPLIPFLEEENIQLELLYLGQLFSPIQIVKALIKLNKVKRNYDVIHGQYGSICAVVSMLGGKGVPKVISIRGSDWNIHRQSFNKAFIHSVLAHFFTLISLPFFNKIIIVSNRMKNTLPMKQRSKTSVMPTPINLDAWKINNSSQIGGKERNILFVAQNVNSSIKGRVLLDEVKELLNKEPIKYNINIAQNILFKDMPRFVRKHDIILCLSQNEGWPNSVKEALACNIPFVATDVSDLKDIADEEGSCFICESNPKDVVRKIKQSFSVPRENLNLRKHVELMDVKVSAKRMKKLYLNLIETK